ncbi:SMP-30/gluconolactonase/LRE family protein [Rhodopirellula sp. JC740]|uniref:SMP-30/gluconolactonase/LRE family protein n=1 Tax=Rhodopirellula halodulae TaxID=2894198 RepID=A0ABS8NNA5_9BACT|nr:SMP-30/gluconolactonase/LRE family protein [Rhodopirellula sp. JC740]MCC9645074.1 SMP-30/gluconolactonase/LRE family protein [Rhodopirellula sp. JC740]
MSNPEIRVAQPLTVPDSDALRFLPEGPMALGENGKLSWVGIQHGADILHGSINVLDLTTNLNQSFKLPGRPGFAFRCQDASKFVAGVERSLGIFDTSNGQWSPFCDGVDADVTNTIINDGLVIDDNLIFGTKDLEFATKKAGLYLYRGSDQKLIRLRDDQICSNGKMIRRDDSGNLFLIDIDSPTRTIVEHALDIEAGTLGDPRVVLDLTSDPGVPDGAILTPNGEGIIVAIFHPGVAEHGETRCYDLESGELRTVWKTPGSPQNTCPALVPVDGQLKLVITTAVENFSKEDQAQCPNAGQLFVGETDWPADETFPISIWPA